MIFLCIGIVTDVRLTRSIGAILKIHWEMKFISFLKLNEKKLIVKWILMKNEC
jgi:hypothetical protein